MIHSLSLFVSIHCNIFVDTHIAQHIVSVHQHRSATIEPPYTTEQLQRYIKFAREFDPTISKESQQELVRCYVKLRESDANGKYSKRRRSNVAIVIVIFIS